MSSGDAISRVLEGRRGKRRFGPPNSDWEDDEKLRLGSEVLQVLADLFGDPDQVESLRLYIGSDVKSITLLCWGLSEAREEFMIDVDGCLVYRWFEARLDLSEGETPMERSMVLAGSGDFCVLSLESVSALHAVVAREDFLDRLAWRLGREGKPGYCTGGFEDERETWRVRAADQGEHTRGFHGGRRARVAREEGF